jgi:lipoate---protein ligase
MLSIYSESHDPFFNLALEEYLLQSRKENFLILSINDPCAVVGKHQVVHREVNAQYIEKTKIPVIRRISGGGTVYHDRGNLNFAFIKQSEAGKQVDFRFYTKPIIDFLSSLGVNAVFEGKNDLTIEGLKVSGNAEHIFRERVLHHGTLLFNASLENLRNALNPKSENYSSRAVESNRSSVTNLKDRLGNVKDTENFMSLLLNYLLVYISDNQIFKLIDTEMLAIEELAKSKYRTWEWNYGYGPQYAVNSWFEVDGNVCRFHLTVKDGIIWESNFEGIEEINAVGKTLIGCRHMFADLLAKLRTQNINVTEEQVYKFF